MVVKATPLGRIKDPCKQKFQQGIRNLVESYSSIIKKVSS